jgi:hypothetical protein
MPVIPIMNDFEMVVTALEGLLYFFASREIVTSRCNISLLPRAMRLAGAIGLILRLQLRFFHSRFLSVPGR